MQSINAVVKRGGHPAVRAFILTVVATLVLVTVGAPHALAQDANKDDSNLRNDVAHTLEGDFDKDKSNRTQDQISDALDKAAKGDLSPEVMDVLNGLGGLREINSGQLEQFLDRPNRDALNAILGNQQVMDQIQKDSPETIGFLEEVAAPILEQVQSNPAATLLDSINAVMNSTTGGEYTLQGGYTYSDLLPSVMYSKKQDSDGVVNSVQLNMGELSKYPVGDAETYGQMNSPTDESTDTAVGRELATYIAGLYEWDWLVTIDNSGKIHGDMDILTSDTFGHTGRAALGSSSLGAKIYDSTTGFIKWLSEAFNNINLPTLLGLTDTGDEDNWLTKTTRSVLDGMGLTKASVQAVQFVILVVVGGAFLLILVAALRQPEKGHVRNPKVRALGVRVMVAVISIPFISVFTGVVNDMSKNWAEDSYRQAAQINSSYVVDTLNWAATSNLSLSEAGYGAPSSANGSVDYYKPTNNAVSSLMSSVDSRGITTGLLPEEQEGRNATDLIDAVANAERVNVNSYLSAISQSKSISTAGGQLNTAVGNIAAAQVPRRNAHITSANHRKMVEEGKGKMIAPYFLTQRGTGEDSGGDSPAGDSGDDNADKPENGEKPSGGAGDAGAHGKNTLFGPNKLQGEMYQCNSGAMSCASVRWNTPATYIYGADTPNHDSRSYRNYTGEIHEQNVQANDPGSGQPADSGIMEANAVSIAMMNRYGGIANVNGAPSLSTQSVAFLLQSTYHNQTLQFNGYNTAAEGASGAKNNGAHGTEFLRYTIPNTGTADLMAKISALSIVWLTSAIIAVVAMIALLRAPLLLALLAMFRGIFAALTGKVSGVLTYVAYFTALRAAFMFVGAAITLGAKIATQLVNLTGATKAIEGVAGEVRGDDAGFFEGLVNDALGDPRGAVASSMTSVANILVCLLICAVICWPLFTIPNHKGQVRKLSIVSVIVILPFVLADMANDWIDGIARKVGEKPMRTQNVFGGRLSGLNQKSEVGATGKRAGRIGRNAAALAAAGVTGGTTALAAAGATGGTNELAGVLGKKKKGIPETVPSNRDGTPLETTYTNGDGYSLGTAHTEPFPQSQFDDQLSNADTAAELPEGMHTVDGVAPGDVDSANYVAPGGGQRAGAAIPVNPSADSSPAIAPTAMNTGVNPTLGAHAVNPALLAAIGATAGAGAGVGSAVAGAGSGGGETEIKRARIEDAEIGNAKIGGAQADTVNAPRDADQTAEVRPASSESRGFHHSADGAVVPVVHTSKENNGGASRERVPDVNAPDTPVVPDNRNAQQDGDGGRDYKHMARTMRRAVSEGMKTAGAAAYGAFDQGRALDKHMENLAQKVKGESRGDSDSRINARDMARSGGTEPSNAAMERLSRNVESMNRNLDKGSQTSKRSVEELRRHSRELRNFRDRDK